MDEQVQIINRVEELGKKPGNNVCAECPERHPNWISLIKSPLRGGETIAAFVCQSCSKHHQKLSSNVCEVKGLTMATKWSFKELGIVSKTGNTLVNGIYEGKMEDFCDDKEIITFDKQEEAKLRGDFIRNKYIKRKYFSEDAFHTTMAKLNPAYKRPDEQSTRASSPRRASLMPGSTHGGVPSTPRRRASIGYTTSTSSPTQTQKENTAVPQTPTNKKQEVPSTPRKSDSALKRNLKDTSSSQQQTPRRAIPSSSSLVTPRNGRRRGSVMNAPMSADPYRRQQQSMLAAVSPLGSEVMEIAMLDGSQRGNRSMDGSQRGSRTMDHHSERSYRKSRSMEDPERSYRGGRSTEDAERSYRGGRSMQNAERSYSRSKSMDDSDRSYRGSRNMDDSERSYRGKRTQSAYDENGRALDRTSSERSMSGSQRGSRSRRPMDKTPSDRSLSGSQRGARSRRGSLAGSDRSHSARDVNRSDRNRRRQSLLRPEDSESESEAERELQPGRNHSKMLQNSSHHKDILMQLPSSLQMAGASQLAPVNPSLKKTSHSMRMSRTSVNLPDGAHSMRAGRTSVVLQEPDTPNKILDRRRSSMLQANQRLSRRSLMEKKPSDRNLEGKRLSRTDSNRSMEGGSRRDSRSMDHSADSLRDSRNSVDYSSRSARNSIEGSRRSDRSSRTSRDKKERSLSREKPKDKSSRGKRSGMKDTSDKSSRGKRSGMKDFSDRASRSRRMKDLSDPDKSSRGKRSNGGERSRRDGRTSGSRKSTSPGRRGVKKSATVVIAPGDYETDETKKKSKFPHRSKSMGTLGELIATGTKDQSTGEGSNSNFDWKSHSKSNKKNPDEGEPKKRSSDPLRSSGHERKGSKSSDPLRNSGHDRKGGKPVKVKRHKSDGTGGLDESDSDSGSDDRRGKRRTERKSDRKSMKKVPSKKKIMSRSMSTGHLSETDSEDVTHRNQQNGKAPNRRLSKGAQSARSLLGNEAGDGEPRRSRRTKKSSSPQNDRSASPNGENKYKNLDGNVLSSTYSAGSLGLLMAAAQAGSNTDKVSSKNSKDKNGLSSSNLSASGTLSFMAQSSASSSKMSDVFGMKAADVKRAGRASIVTQWMSPTDVAVTAVSAAAAVAKVKKDPSSPDKKEKKVEHKSYDDAIVAQWLAT